MGITVDNLYGEIWGRDAEGLERELRRSLQPRHADTLYDRMLALGLASHSLLLDIGARDGRHAIELVRRSGCRAYVVDPVALHMTKAAQRAQESGLAERIVVHQGGIEHIPLDTAEATHIWCRDMLNHVVLAPGLQECARVLQPGGAMLVYQTFATALMEPNEASRLYQAMAIVADNMQPDFFERAAGQAGFRILERDQIDSEWRERWAEQGDREQLESLLLLARLHRREDDLVQRYGRAVYEATRASLQWGVYQFLGKLCPTVYILEKKA
jgi:ubiquinone/menaquinone biosynthesis C-methylase UbiE